MDSQIEHSVNISHLFARAAFSVSHAPDGVVRGAAHHEPISILKAGDSSLVAVQSAYKLAGTRAPHLQRQEAQPSPTEDLVSLITILILKTVTRLCT